MRLGLTSLLLVLLGCTTRQLGIGTTSSGSESDGNESTGDATTSDATTTPLPDDGFIPDPDVPPPPCNPFEQDCPDGQKCIPEGICVPVLGEQAPGEPCEFDPVAGTDDCDETSACWNLGDVDGEPVGFCAEFCKYEADTYSCPEGSSCDITGSGGSLLCIPLCDPLAQDCGPGLGCYWTHGDFNCMATTMSIPVGEPCGFINDCAPGLGCLTAEVMPDCQGSACCGSFCNLALGDEQCEILPGTVCSKFFEAGTEPPGYEQLGVCVLP